MNKDFTFSTKSNTLKFLKSRLKFSSIEKIYDFNVEEWESNPKQIISNIQSKFKSKIIIRSSAIGEDSETNSFAGAYDSILNIDSKLSDQIIQAINSVIDSYRVQGNLNLQNQILIQNQTSNIFLNGVLFSRNENNGSPYFTINYEKGSSTTNVTHGKTNNVIKIFRDIDFNILTNEWKLLLKSIKEIEQVLDLDNLDIEFAITKSNKIVIFQVRPITTINSQYDFSQMKLIKNQINSCKKLFLKSGNNQNIFSDMADWNPSEIIGSNPNLLDYSLYSYLIMDSVWHQGRIDLGYASEKLPPLMTQFGNKPFVNIKASFDSLLPNSIPKKLRTKIVTYCMKKLKHNPHLHDKVEFEILFTCYDLNTDSRLKELLQYNFSKDEVELIRNHLINFTNNLILNFLNYFNDFDKKIKKLLKNRESLLNSCLSNSNYYDNLKIAKQLLEDCISLGTIPFSSSARIAFISNAILKSLSNQNSSIDTSKIMNSISTPLTQLCDDLNLLNNNKLEKFEFIEKYGHLRPGTYDITASRYDENNPFFKNMKFLDVSSETLDQNMHNEINAILNDSLLDFSKIDFYSFLEKSISQREFIKFFFTKNLSDALELIAKAGSKLGFSRMEISNLDVETIFLSNTTEIDLKNLWHEKILQENDKKIINNFIFLPPIITSKNDFELIQYINTKPNFITNDSIDGKIINLNKNISSNLENKIILIENADPGYDWIFTKNPIGLITKYGGAASHMAIRCLEIGLPAAIGCGDLLYEKLLASQNILLDCNNERIIILENERKNDDDLVNKTLKSIGYIK
jgi:glutamine kinase